MNKVNHETEVVCAVRAFVEAFDRLDWPTFSKCFDSRASVFFPFDDTPQRLSGKKQVLARFEVFFEATRRRVNGPYYLNLQPQDLSLDVLDNTALVTFHLQGEDHFSRRTLVLVKQAQGWLIRHLHASRIMQSGNAPSQDSQ